ncbi:prefoldin subunit beta [Candidatus Woesearchaeota archaeon]|nr:prefoldin subunit beta [Candidatus Woesearchaeota archaeon]
MTDGTEAKIQQMQMLEQSLTTLTSQKQQFQLQLAEIESALGEIKDKKEAFKIVGNIMIKKNKEDIEKDLKMKKEVAEVRIKSIDSQEKKLREKAQTLQQEVMEELQKKEEKKK